MAQEGMTMTRTTKNAPNTLTVADDSGATIGTLLVSVSGFVAFSAAGRSLGGFSSMGAAIAALEIAARK